MSKSAIDLSALPLSVRQQVEAGLAKLPPEMRQKLLEEGSPLLTKAIERATARAATVSKSTIATTAASEASSPAMAATSANGQYSRTVMPGDRLGLSGWLVVIVAVALLAYWLFG